MMRILRGGAVFVLAAISGGAWAGETSIGGVSIKLPPPAGFCDLTASQPSDNRMLMTIGGIVEKTGNRLLGFSADCQQLADWRAGRRPFLEDYAQFQATTGMDQTISSPPAFVHEVCATLRAQGDEINSSVAPDVKSKIESALNNVKMNSLTFVGVLAEDDTACYAAQIQKMRTETGTDKTQLNLMAITVVKGKAIFVTRYAQYTSSDATSGLLTKLKDTVAALQSANK